MLMLVYFSSLLVPATGTLCSGRSNAFSQSNFHRNLKFRKKFRGDGYIYMVPCPVFPPPPMGWGGMMPLWWCIYIHTYLHTYLPTYIPTYIHTYIPLHYLTLHYLTLPYIPYLTFHTYIHTYIYRHTHTYIHTYIYRHTHIHTYIHIQTHTHTYIHTSIHHTYIHTYQHTYQHTNIPTYQHTNIPTYQHTTTTGHRGGDQKNHTTTTGHRGGGPEEPDDTVHPYPLVGGGRGGGQRCTIYINTVQG